MKFGYFVIGTVLVAMVFASVYFPIRKAHRDAKFIGEENVNSFPSAEMKDDLYERTFVVVELRSATEPPVNTVILKDKKSNKLCEVMANSNKPVVVGQEVQIVWVKWLYDGTNNQRPNVPMIK